MILLRLFYEYFKIGLFSIGGGLATVPFLSELGEKTSWFTLSELADMIAVSESTPGPIGVNMASSIGFKLAGIPGVFSATFGLVAPSFIVILIIISLLNKFKDSEVVNAVFTGLRPASLALITSALISVILVSLIDLSNLNISFWSIFNLKSILLALALFFVMKKIKIHPFFYILASAFIGIIFKFAQ